MMNLPLWGGISVAKELWKYVSGDEFVFVDGSPRYLVSNWGKVKQLSYTDDKGVFHDERELKQYVDSKNRHSVSLQRVKGCPKRVWVHALVAEAFVEKPDGATKVVHLDSCPFNNLAENLAWSFKAPKKVVKADEEQRKRKRCTVRQYTESGVFVAEYPSTVEAAKAVHISSGGQISQCCNRVPNHNTSAGFIWRYSCDDEYSTDGRGS